MTRLSWTYAAACLIALLGGSLAAWGQEPAARESAESVDAADARERDEILAGRRWQRVRREFHDWLAVQEIYDADEVEQIKDDIDFHAHDMTAPELLQMIDDLEDRLDVLLSPEAAEARQWLGKFLSVQAKYSDDELRAKRPDVINMSGAEIRRELEQLQRRRAGTRQAQSAFERARAGEVQARRAATAAPARPRPQRPERAAAGESPFRSRYAPVRNEVSPATRQRSNFWIDPDGNLNRWGWGL
jgi:hypothetical protein